MAPNVRRDVPEPHRSKLLEIVALMRSLPAQRDEAIADALKAGGSIRSVAELVGLTHSQVLAIGHRHGWPSEEFKAAREARRKEREESERRSMQGHGPLPDMHEAYPELFGPVDPQD